MTGLQVRALRHDVGHLTVSIDHLQVDPGRRLVVFGPNGAGKTTLLRLLAGVVGRFPAPRSVYLPQRPYMFRGSALFNLGLGLDPALVPAAHEHATNLGVAGSLDKAATALSGGERQRIALARALADPTDIALLDEPLNAIDAQDRDRVAAYVATALEGRTAVIVTHDRGEAVTLGHDLAVMIDGRIQQIGVIEDVLSLPADEAVAGVLGISNALTGRVSVIEAPLVAVDIGAIEVWGVGEAPSGADAKVLFGAETVIVYSGHGAETGSARNRWVGRVDRVRPLGQLVELVIDVGPTIAAVLTPGSVESMGLSEGADVTVAVKATAVRVVRK